MHKFRSLSLLLFLTLSFAGCADVASEKAEAPQNGTQSTLDSAKKIKIVASFYPLAEIAQVVGGESVSVKNLVPAGAEPHDFEPTPKDVIAMNEADLIILNGAGFEPWGDKVSSTVREKGVQVLNVSNNIGELLHADEDGLSEEDDDHAHGEFDPHFWLDPLSFVLLTQQVEQKLSEIDPEHANMYQKNADAYIAQLQTLHGDFVSNLSTCRKKVFVTNHAAFAYLAHRYGLEMHPISGLSPESEPSAKQMADIATLVKSNGIEVIYTETLLNPKTSETIAKEAGARTLTLNPLEGLTDSDLNKGENYISVMKMNLDHLMQGLDCM